MQLLSEEVKCKQACMHAGTQTALEFFKYMQKPKA